MAEMGRGEMILFFILGCGVEYSGRLIQEPVIADSASPSRECANPGVQMRPDLLYFEASLDEPVVRTLTLHNESDDPIEISLEFAEDASPFAFVEGGRQERVTIVESRVPLDVEVLYTPRIADQRATNYVFASWFSPEIEIDCLLEDAVLEGESVIR